MFLALAILQHVAILIRTAELTSLDGLAITEDASILPAAQIQMAATTQKQQAHVQTQVEAIKTLVQGRL